MITTDHTLTQASQLLQIEDEHVAHNYHPLDVVVASGSGAVLTDTDGVQYLDFLAAYSATNFGHCHPALVAAAKEQLERLTLTSRAFHHDQLAPFAEGLAELDRQGHGAADEHRRRGCGVGDQGRTQVGL